MARPVVDLPQPDSPTRPSVSPGSTSKLMPDTALTFRPVRPTGNSTTRSSTRRTPRRRGGGGPCRCPAISSPAAAAHASAVAAPATVSWYSGEPTGYQQAYTWPGVSASTSGGSSTTALVAARRGSGARSGSPSGGLTRSGGRPPMISSWVWLGFSSFGMLFSSASVYGIFMLANSDRRRRLLDDLAGVHHGDLVGAPGHHAEVVGDEDHRHVAVALLVGEQVEDLGLHGDVERGRGLVGEQQRGAAGERDGDGDALAHAARQLVRVLVEPAPGLGDADVVQQALGGGRRPPCAACRGGARSDSVIWRPIFITGFSDVIGSWKIMAISVPQILRISFGG